MLENKTHHELDHYHYTDLTEEEIIELQAFEDRINKKRQHKIVLLAFHTSGNN